MSHNSPSIKRYPSSLIPRLIPTGLPTKIVVTIALGSILNAMASPILAQGEQPLVLQKGDEVVTIPVGDWVAAEAGGYKVLGTGEYQGIEDGILILQESPSKVSLRYLGHVLRKDGSTWGEHRIPITDIAIMYHGEAWRVGYHAKHGLNQGLLIGVGWGSVVGLILGWNWYNAFIAPGTEEGEEPEPAARYLAGGALVGAVYCGFYGALIGIPIGAGMGLIKHWLAKRYLIGPGQWEIWE